VIGRPDARWQGQGRVLLWLSAAFLAAWWLPSGQPRFENALLEGLALVKWYAQEHVLLCLLPAFFIAGAIAVFIKKDAVLRTLGPLAPRWLAYGTASVSGTILAVCSCTVLPLFAGIYKRGAGLGPATAFLYSGPAINILAILLTARILGWELGLARAVGAVLFSLLVGLAMAWLFRREEAGRAAEAGAAAPLAGGSTAAGEAGMARGLRLLGLQLAILILANWSGAGEPGSVWAWVHGWRWPLTGAFAALLAWRLHADYRLSGGGLLLLAAVTAGLSLSGWISETVIFGIATAGLVLLLLPRDDEMGDWLEESWGFTRQIMPLLLGGVLVAGLLLGSPEGGEGLVPGRWVAAAVGGNSLGANFLSSLAGALMYFATLTEIPILQGLLGAGMGKGPALALLLAGPALSLPNLLVIRSVLGGRKTAAFTTLVVVLSTLAGFGYGLLPG
jgi:uncharacterized protein